MIETQKYTAVCNISFDEKIKLLSYEYLKCCKYISEFKRPEHIFTKKLFLTLTSSSQLLEDFLDLHGAKNNTKWLFYRELTATVRHLSLAGYSQKHILNRLPFYLLEHTDKFSKEGEVTLLFITKSLMKLAPVILEEADNLNIPLPATRFQLDDFPGISAVDMLEYDIDDEERDLQKKNIVKVSSEFLSTAKELDQFRFYEHYEIEDLLLVVPDKVNEVVIRRFELLIHNLQSLFDTYVIHGGYRFGNRKLKQLRGHISVILHLLQTIGRLLHFYERHLHNVGYKVIYRQVLDKLSQLINPDLLLDRTINYGLYYTCQFLSKGKKVAQEILNENIERSSLYVGIPVQRGFHSRPSLLVAKVVLHYGGQVELCVGDDRFDASSVLDIQWAGGKIQKENVQQVKFEGDVRALNDIKILASVNYGEDTMGKGIPLPQELKYLR